MGTTVAVTTSSLPTVVLNGFNDEVVSKLHLPPSDSGAWVIIGRVTLYNFDGDPQDATAKLVHDANVVIDEVYQRIQGDHASVCVSLQACLVPQGKETITLEANTFKGGAQSASIIAFQVDTVDFQ